MSDVKEHFDSVGKFLIVGDCRVPLEAVMTYGINRENNRVFVVMDKRYWEGVKGSQDVHLVPQNPTLQLDSEKDAEDALAQLDDIMVGENNRRLLHG